MAVGDAYLIKMRRAVRVGQNADVNAELTDLVEECRRDLMLLGVLEEKVNDETDSVILGAVRCFVRWKFGVNNPEAIRLQEEYMMLRDELRRRRAYCTSPTG